MAGSLFVAVCAVQLSIAGWYAGKVYPGVSVAGMSLGGMTRGQAKQALQHKIEGYQLKLTVGDKAYSVDPAEAGVEYNLNATVDDALAQGRSHWLLPLAVLQAKAANGLSYSYAVDTGRQQQFVAAIVAASGQLPQDASIVIKNGTPTVQPDVNGRSISAEEVQQALHRQITTVNTVPIVLTPSTQVARIKAADVTPAIEQTKQLLATPVSITYKGQIFKPSAAQLDDWVSYDKSATTEAAGLKPKVNADGIKHYLQSVALKVNVNPINRKVKIQDGVTSEERAGVKGLQLEQEALAAAIVKAVTSGQPLTIEATTKEVPFQTETNKIITLNYGKYIEINLKKQHLWVYQDKQVIFESPITSGATGAGYPTVQGLFSVQAKQTNRNLNGYAIGYNYNVFVKYWMPFFGNYGLHDATWRSSFGGQDYYYGGSHGCVNLPDATAAFLFGWADVGTPVWVHS
jgi:lipoprotein-anchoring transpeptidase ErfK/SrfK